MKAKHFFISLLVVVFPLSMIAGAVYMKKEPDGTTSFSDVPSSGSSEVKIEAPNLIEDGKKPEEESSEMPDGLVPPTGVPKSDETPSKSPQGPELPQKEVYKSVEITSPKDQQTIWNPASITVNVAVSYGDNKTGLQKGDKVILLLDGQKVGDPGASTSFTLSRDQVPRGEHKLQATVVNENNTVLITSKTITIFIHMSALGLKKTVLNKKVV